MLFVCWCGSIVSYCLDLCVLVMCCMFVVGLSGVGRCMLCIRCI